MRLAVVLFVAAMISGCIGTNEPEKLSTVDSNFSELAFVVPSGKWISFAYDELAKVAAFGEVEINPVASEWNSFCTTVLFHPAEYPFTFFQAANNIWLNAEEQYVSVNLGGASSATAALGAGPDHGREAETVVGHAHAGGYTGHALVETESGFVQREGDFYCLTGPEQFATHDYQGSFAHLDGTMKQTIEIKEGMLLMFEHELDTAQLTVEGPSQTYELGDKPYQWICSPEAGAWTIDLTASALGDWEFAIQVFDKAQPNCFDGVKEGTSYQG